MQVGESAQHATGALCMRWLCASGKVQVADCCLYKYLPDSLLRSRVRSAVLRHATAFLSLVSEVDLAHLRKQRQTRRTRADQADDPFSLLSCTTSPVPRQCMGSTETRQGVQVVMQRTSCNCTGQCSWSQSFTMEWATYPKQRMIQSCSLSCCPQSLAAAERLAPAKRASRRAHFSETVLRDQCRMFRDAAVRRPRSASCGRIPRTCTW
jgi:hypothetical protein